MLTIKLPENYAPGVISFSGPNTFFPHFYGKKRNFPLFATPNAEHTVPHPACDYIDEKIQSSRFAGQEFLVIDMSNITKLDSGAAEQFAMFVKTKNVETGDNLLVYFTSVRPVVKKALIRAEGKIKENIYKIMSLPNRKS